MAHCPPQDPARSKRRTVEDPERIFLSLRMKNMTFRANQAESLEQMVDWERGLITGRIFTDEEIYKYETEKLFPRTWIYLAHEDQLKDYGDFLSTYIGADRILVVRQRDGSIKALLNACRHRGMGVCRADIGNAKSFMCSFHGWTYDAAG